MTEKLKEIIKREIANLPKETRDAINSFAWGNIAEQIGEKYRLSESETNDLQVETLLVLAGLSSLDFFAVNVESNVGTSKDEATKIASEVDEKIFTPIYNKIHENIKKNLITKKPKLDQDIDFILSGGDYSVFLEPSSGDFSPSTLQGEGRGEVKERGNDSTISGYTTNTPPKMMDLKNKFLYDNEKNT